VHLDVWWTEGLGNIISSGQFCNLDGYMGEGKATSLRLTDRDEPNNLISIRELGTISIYDDTGKVVFCRMRPCREKIGQDTHKLPSSVSAS
jgi:hypothetical protein